MKNIKGYLLVAAAATCWGIADTVAKYLFNQNYDTLIVVQMRSSLSFLVMFFIIVVFKRGLLKVERGKVTHLVILGVIGIAMLQFVYYFAIRETSVAIATLMQYTAPVLVMVYTLISKEERLQAEKVISLVLSMGGCFLVVTRGTITDVHISTLGLSAGIASSVIWAFMNIHSKHTLKGLNTWAGILYMLGVAGIFWLIINPPQKIVEANYSLHDWGIFFGFAMLSVLIPYMFYFSGLKCLQATRAIITSTFEPVVAIGASWMFLSESLRITQVIGAVSILAAIIILQLKQEVPIPQSGISDVNC